MDGRIEFLHFFYCQKNKLQQTLNTDVTVEAMFVLKTHFNEDVNLKTVGKKSNRLQNVTNAIWDQLKLEVVWNCTWTVCKSNREAVSVKATSKEAQSIQDCLPERPSSGISNAPSETSGAQVFVLIEYYGPQGGTG